MSGSPTARQRAARLAVGGLVAADAAVGAAYLALLIGLFVTGRTRGADLTAFYTAWRMVLDGVGGRLYDVAAQTEHQQRVLGGLAFGDGLNAFVNPPQSVLPFVPLGALSLDAAYLAWAALGLVLLAVTITILLRTVAEDWDRLERIGLVAFAVAFPPAVIALYQGSFSLIALAALAGSWAAVVAGRDVLAGVLLACATVKPQAVLGPLVATPFWRRWRLLASLIGVILALSLLATVVLGPATWGDYASLVSTLSTAFDRMSVRPAVMWNLRGTLTIVLGPGAGPAINVAGLAGLAVATVAIAWLWRAGLARTTDPRDAAIRFALTIVLGLVLGPHVNPQDAVVAIPAIALAYGALRRTVAGEAIGIVALASPVAILLVNGLAVDGASVLPIRLPTVALFAFAGVLAWALRERPWEGSSRGSVGVPAGSEHVAPRSAH